MDRKFIHKAMGLFKLDGAPACAAADKDQLHPCDATEQRVYHILESAKPTDYPRLMEAIHGMLTGKTLDFIGRKSIIEELCKNAGYYTSIIHGF